MADLCGPTLEHLTVIDESLITEFDLRPNTFCISGPRGNGFWVRFLDGGPWAIPWEGRPFGLGNLPPLVCRVFDGAAPILFRGGVALLRLRLVEKR